LAFGVHSKKQIGMRPTGGDDHGVQRRQVHRAAHPEPARDTARHQAQQPAKVPRIGVLASASAERAKSRLAALQQALHALGYVEGHIGVIESRYAAGEYTRLPDMAAELVRLHVDVIMTEGTAAVQAAQQSTTTIPIVMGNANDPVGNGLVASLARPGGNITG